MIWIINTLIPYVSLYRGDIAEGRAMSRACWVTGFSIVVLLLVLFGGLADVHGPAKPVKVHSFANKWTTGRLRASVVFLGTFLEVRFMFSAAESSRVRLRVRVVGPSEVFLLELKPSDRNELRGRFEVSHWDQVDEYSIETTVFTYDFDEDDIETNVLLTNETYFYQLVSEDLEVGHLTGKVPTVTEEQPRRWILRDDELVDVLRCTRKPDAPSWCTEMPDRIWNRYFAAWYIPPPPHELDKEALELVGRAPRTKLGEDQRVCFFGDSQMRHLFNNFVMATSDYKAMPVVSAEKEVMPSDRHKYFQKRWSGFDFGEQEVSDCTDVVVNMGQWPAGWPEGRPWSFLEYSEGVRADMEDLQALSQRLGIHPRRLYWLSTNPYGYMDVNGRSIYGPNAVEWRWDGVVDNYNRLARSVAEASGIQYLDISSIAKPLSDLPYDGAHYAGIVGDEMAWEVVAALTTGR